MKSRSIYLDEFLGRKVFDSDGQCAGRIEEVVARADGGSYVVEEFLLGRGGLFQRLSIAHFAHKLIGILGASGFAPSHRAGWEQIDLTNPRHPRLRCSVSSLKKIRD